MYDSWPTSCTHGRILLSCEDILAFSVGPEAIHHACNVQTVVSELHRSDYGSLSPKLVYRGQEAVQGGAEKVPRL